MPKGAVGHKEQEQQKRSALDTVFSEGCSYYLQQGPKSVELVVDLWEVPEKGAIPTLNECAKEMREKFPGTSTIIQHDELRRRIVCHNHTMADYAGLKTLYPKSDVTPVEEIFHQGWDVPIAEAMQAARNQQMSKDSPLAIPAAAPVSTVEGKKEYVQKKEKKARVSYEEKLPATPQTIGFQKLLNAFNDAMAADAFDPEDLDAMCKTLEKLRVAVRQLTKPQPAVRNHEANDGSAPGPISIPDQLAAYNPEERQEKYHAMVKELISEIKAPISVSPDSDKRGNKSLVIHRAKSVRPGEWKQQVEAATQVLSLVLGCAPGKALTCAHSRIKLDLPQESPAMQVFESLAAERQQGIS